RELLRGQELGKPREQPGARPRSARAGDLPTARMETLRRVGGEREDMLLDALRSEPEQDLHRRVQAPDAGKILQRRLEACRAGAECSQVVVEMRFALGNAVVAHMRRLQSIERVGAAIEDAGADRGKQPFMAAKAEKIDGQARKIERQSAHPLDGVEIEQYAALTAELGGCGEVLAEAVRELHGAEGD